MPELSCAQKYYLKLQSEVYRPISLYAIPPASCVCEEG